MKQSEKIAHQLVLAREAAGKTQADAAKYLGKTYQAISNWERGQTKIDSVSLLQLLSFYGADIYEFMESCDFTILSRMDGDTISEDARQVAEAYDLLETAKEKNMIRSALGLPSLPADDELSKIG